MNSIHPRRYFRKGVSCFEFVLVKLCSLFDPMFDYWHKARKMYRRRTGKRMNYCHPHDINEKMMWLTRYWQNPLKTLCADKLLVRDYVTSCGLANILVPLLGEWDQANDICFSTLPDSFVLKCNHGSHYNIIVQKKESINEPQIINQLDLWMREDYSQRYFELHYRDIPRKIICEKLLSDTAPVEYQCWCINGIIDSLLVCRKGYDGGYDAWSYSTKWDHLCDRIGETPSSNAPKPKHLDLILEYASLLSKPFPFVRADFYEVDGIIYFAELTFAPCGHVLEAYKPEFVERLGIKLSLPPKYVV